MAATSAANERSIAIPGPGDDQPAAQPAALAGGGDEDEGAWKTAQKWLNRFVRVVAFVERTGNAVGTLAFTWATVVVLGGYSTDLREDFWYAMAIVFLEAYRVFSRQNKSDDKFLFKTTGGIRVLKLSSTLELLYFLNAVIVMLCLSVILTVVLTHVFPKKRYVPLVLAALLVLLARFPIIWLLKRANRPGSGRRVVAIVLRLTPLAAILALGCSLVLLYGAPPVTVLASVLLLFMTFVLCQQLIAVREKIKRPAPLQRPTAAGEASPPPPSFAQRAWLVLANTMLVVCPPLMVAFLTATFGFLGLYVVLTAVALGNFQIPAAVARVAISSARLAGRVDRVSTGNVNLVPSLKIFYGLVLAQGALYIVACLTDPFSVLLRRWLARRCKLGTRSVDLYYEHAYDAWMEDGLLAMEDANIVSFAVDSLSAPAEPSRSRERVLAGVTVLHCFLRQRRGSKARLASSKIITSTNAIATLIGMLGWGAEEDRQIRLFAAKVIGEVAGELRIARFPGTVQLISSLLDAPSCSKKEQDSGGSTQTKAAAGNVNTDSTCCCCFPKPSCPRRIKNLWSAPDEEPLDDDEDALPIMGMLILEKLASDPENCAEIWRATNLVSKVIGFIACSSNEAQRNRRPITASSLKLVAKLAGAKGEIGVTLRRKISDHPFLVSSLAGILEDDGAGTEEWSPAMDILAKLCVNADTRQEVGEIAAIITRLVQEFFPSQRDQQASSTQDDRQLRLAAGEALATLATESPGNCSAILKEFKGKYCDLVNDLKNMISARDEDGCRCAASLLQNLCAHSGDELRHLGFSDHLASALKVILEKILNTKGKQLEVLIGLTAQIHNAMPACFKDALESLANNTAEALVQKMVDTLNSSKKPSPECPRMRRAIVELAISIVETRTLPYGYAADFRKKGMVEALSKVKRTPSKVERYRLFFGDAGVVL
ncbi:uncharacterized protein [Oryza sativa Japonica Group]|uniref:Os01g0618300 protein n=2 Tax=Oryza sativa subsp. japonica TaxID=39947 RepID=A0A0P0V5B3_ORYSJ|nr:uncharacterized protein LOC9271825 [Oryza sativa Japonica Group]KAB8082269.1 hypothetical protein EE612_004100 [Oryza sativa]KAF2951200.1 hypothetical protein DAI22_01g244400 [Oryza sativa Japonica Group]BAH91195.1 Os01g0618300 [Oryza sativa Japonica Group]BAS73189.1 Os01g0618300 [Oryza sativa Japonica Group]|eukprot:NP_001172465.1 Os01g0618300 [Oryza sativa Japonica Group]